MVWSNVTGRLLLRCKLSYPLRNVPILGSLRRYKSTSAANEHTHPWDNSWLTPESKLDSNAAPRKSKGLALKFPNITSIDRGVSIDKRGQLKVVYRALAEKDCLTVLILSAASTHLTRADFTRLLPGHSGTGVHGIEAVIPGRHTRTLDRLPYWILLFKTPFLAASYQSRLRWYHQNAVENLPVNPLQAALTPGRGLTPPPGWIDPESGEDVWKALHEYTLLQPLQDFSLTALLPEFPPSVNQAIQRSKTWNHSNGTPCWTVRIRVDGKQLTRARILQFLEKDGKARHRPWMMAHHELARTPVHAHVQSGPEISHAVLEETSEMRQIGALQNFIVKFGSEGEAMRFWRTWHRMPFPLPPNDGVMPGVDDPLVHVELAW